MESLLIRTLVILGLIVALPALLIIILLLDVARQLLSRNIFVTPSCPNEDRAEESSDETAQA